MSTRDNIEAGGDRDKNDKFRGNSQVKHVPKDAQVIMSILKELGVQDYEPRVINQLLEFTYRYVTCILDDAKAFANHARKKIIDLEDVKLASEVVLDKAFTNPPPRHVLAKLAEVRNSMPLPLIKQHCGLRLPPDRYCLSACNYKLRAASQSKKMTKSAIESRSTLKTQIKPQQNQHGVKRQQINQPKPSMVSIPKPVFKFSSNKVTASGNAKPTLIAGSSAEIKMEIDDDGPINGSGGGGGTKKREREDDEFEIVQ